MAMCGNRLGVIAALLLAATPLLAGETETGDLEQKPGFVDAKTGVRIEEIVVSPSEDVKEVHLTVPGSAGPIEEVIVRAQAPKRRDVEQKRHYTFRHDLEHDNYGLVIYIGKHEDVPLRLYMNSRQQRPGEMPKP